MPIGEKIRLIRKGKHLSQKQLAEKSGISTTYLCDIEKGRGTGSVRVLLLISKALNVELQDIFSG